MTNMRDKIEDIIWGNCHNGDNGGSCDRAADAILAALPDMIAPLVWELNGTFYRARCLSGDYWIMKTQNSDNDKYMINHLSLAKGSHTLGYIDGIQQAKAVAKTHHRAAIMVAFTGATSK
jgi:hypothetical protein